MSGERPYAVRAVDRVLDLLEVLRSHPGGATLAELAAATGLPKSSAFRYLATLEGRGYVERTGSDGYYRLGMALLSPHARQVETLVVRARPVLEGLRDRFEETVNLGVLDGSRVIYLEIVETHRGMRFAARKGDREPLHSTALGKAIASVLSEERVRTMLGSEGMPQRTARTITDPERFLEEVARVRERGYALDDRENEEDGRCVAVPVRGVTLPTAISLSAPAARFSLEDAETAAAALAEAARRIGGSP